ncbi:radical SAM family heme chaperone HemW [Marivita geojedonensis]|uniref:Heme chaperone HemW n=1 Tax=Marivita geojedonensis TaxID=1123756 RepID=A0A1X4NJZ7_9RHOB|nr:radical SAM family heme chaperone HemW [Marivita geojedonensis]OSQ49903.1 coproporphyrinogen III oxidase [Marivita geojedonensis]PRY76131.1 oxygen-independent coproporphyrinogen-3 oxidase [Marivita geojedonensis]
MTELWQDRGFGLYVHWPFCAAKCPYCDFNSHVRASIDQSAWAQALTKEIRRTGAQTGPRVLTSVFFGGGTPSLMEPETVGAVLAAARDVWSFSNDIEITLEANPTSVEAYRFEGYAKLGVNRVSLGVQALNNPDLQKLGRLHSVSEAQSAFSTARQFFERVSFDLIYARQNQTLDSWRSELNTALELAVDHLSLYQLTIEEGTAFWDRAQRGLLRGLPTDDLGADLYELTQELCSQAGFTAYEVSNHARPGAESKHNLLYWRGGDYAGVGPGAHGRLTLNGQRLATECWKNPEAWLAGVESGTGVRSTEPLSPQDVADERLIMGLRLSEGLYLDDVSEILDWAKLEQLHSESLIWRDEKRFGATQQGRPVLNYLISQLAKG